MRHLFFLFSTLSTLLVAPVTAQVGEFVGDEDNLYAATKQVNQFLRRFNGEEDLTGRRYRVSDSSYREPELRRKYINILFDNKQKDISTELKEVFMSEIVDASKPEFLNFHGGSWFAQVSTKFNYKGQDETLQLFLRLQKEPIGSKWVIFKAYFDPFKSFFEIDTVDKGKFIHPMSHELDFMNLRKIFKDPEVVAVYANRDFQPDYLSLILYEIKKGNLTFSSVERVKFHFFQLDDWYFELTEFNRSGPNTGWLISNLLKTDSQQKQILREFIYYEGH